MPLGKLGRRLQPDLQVNRLTDVPLESLWHRGIRALIVDLDNTVTYWNSPVISETVQAWFRAARERGFALCLSSNNVRTRAAGIAQTLQVPVVSGARKPRRRAFRQMLEILGSRPEETAVIGDQVFTDVLGGKRLGLYTVLVRPLGSQEFLLTRFLRRLERLVMRYWGAGET
ncbi:MAG: YqeG family HAD IIIA-type phosphatase [Clostridia bacterium]|nr:YqeG family HAD IIIA-type phosphatase [Clostridia bacterium]MDH7572624.1 YqeG family HAD IIIA-type phosphatase [Clostridia bacterium]